ncbi:MAG: hypothetical protein JKX85_07150 [Phycisphaeraceae bacterium]|nr:hypothetical protein [Phycisphaeraceae bacterium]
MRIIILVIISAIFALPSVAQAEQMLVTDRGVELALTADGTNLIHLKIQGLDTLITGTEESALWEVRILDEQAHKLNDTPLRPAKKRGYWSDPWHESPNRISSRDAKLVSDHWDPQKHLLTLNYEHPLVDVSLRYIFADHRLDMQATVTNKGTDPLSYVDIPARWQINYQPGHTLIVPHMGTGVEYASLKGKYPFWMCNAAWDGLLVNGPADLMGFYRVQHHKPKAWLATETNMMAVTDNDHAITIRNGTIIYRNTGESVETVTQSIGRYPNIRKYADEYLSRNFPNMRTLAQKVPAAIRETLASAVHMPVVGRFNYLANVVKKLPGKAIIHTVSYMRAAPGGGGNDSFPNYFPPNKSRGGSMEDYTNLVQSIHKAGHLFLPRTSFFYWVQKSDVDQDGKLYDMAIRRVNGLPRTAKWGLTGILASPSSKRVNQYIKTFFKQWTDLGVDLYFTNVLGAMAPYGNRYDFHPDAPRPDLFYDQIANMMAWHGKQIPMFTEGGGAWLLPYQTGYFHAPGWNPSRPNPSKFLYDGTRGKFIGFREEMQTYFTHQYAMTLPHNINGGQVQDSPRELTFSFLYGIQFKSSLPSKVDYLTPPVMRWYRTLGILGQTVQKQLWGKRLDKFTRLDNHIERADYQGNIVTANFSKNPYTFNDAGHTHTIIPEGFHFRSDDGKIVAGWYSQFNDMQLSTPQLLIVQIDDEGKQKIFAPLAKEDVELFIPADKPKSIAAFAYSDDKTRKPLQLLPVNNGVLVKIPCFDARLESFIPHVQLCTGQPVLLANQAPLQVHASWAQTGKAKLGYQFSDELPSPLAIKIQINNFDTMSYQDELQITGMLFGIPWTTNTKVAIAPGSQSLILPVAALPSGDKTRLKLSFANLKPFSMTTAVTLESDSAPSLVSIEQVEKIAPICFDYATRNSQFPEMVTRHADVTITRKGLRVSPTGLMEIDSDSLHYRKRVYLECLIKINADPIASESTIIIARKPKGKYGRSIELRYNHRLNAFRFMVASDNAVSDLTAFDVPVELDTWYHLIAYADGKQQVLSINGQQVQAPMKNGLQKWVGPWRIGGDGLDATLSHIRIGGK